MNRTEQNKIKISKEQRKEAVGEIIAYFLQERDEQIGDLAAGFMLDFILEKIGPYVYNQAVADIQKYCSEKVEDMDGFMY